MSVRFKVQDIPADEQLKIDNFLTFDPIVPASRKYNYSQSFRPATSIDETRVKMYFTKEKILHMPFWFAAKYYKQTFNQTKKYDKIFEGQARETKFSGRLRKNQVDPFKKSLEYINEYKTVTIALYPGFGKTFMGVMLSWYLNLKVCVLVHRDNIGKAWLTTFKTCFTEKMKTPSLGGKEGKEIDVSSLPNGNEDITWVDEKGNYNPDAKIFVVMDGRVKKLSDKVKRSIGTLIIDEAHLFCTKSRVEPMLSFSPKYVIAETATPRKENGMHRMIQAICGPHYIEKISDKPYDFYLIQTGLDYEINDSKNIFNDLVTHQSYNEERNKLIIDLLTNNRGYKTIIITKLKDHCKKLKELIEKEGLESSELFGSKKNYVAKNILIGTGSKMGVGFDEANFCDDYDGRPSDLLIITQTFKSWPMFEQVRGRGMRSDHPSVIMFNDNHAITKKHFRQIKKWVKETNGTLHEIKLKDIENYELENLKTKKGKK